MKLRNKIFLSVAAVLVVGVAAVMIAISHDSPCPAAPPPATGADSMLAITRRCYGPPGKVLALERIARPRPAAGEILVRIHAASVNPYEWHMVTGRPYVMRLMGAGVGAPHDFRVAYDMAGIVEAVGEGVTRFKVGDAVFGGAHGALAEYALAREDGAVVIKPPEIGFEDAAALLIAGGTALQALRDQGHVAAGQKVLINGASGGVGTYAVQLAKAFGAEVTGVCSTRNLDLVRSLGADHVIDYTREDFTAGAQKYDLIVDNVGNHSFADLRRLVTATGTIVNVSGPKTNSYVGPLARIIELKMLAPFVDQRLVAFISSPRAADLELFAKLMQAGKLKSAIDRRYPLQQAGAALEYIGSRHARGKVIITVH
ncbi:MAG TPA: NAD(P)-dependent alcohol dehydrogenase [Steroidobacteraceae bacterium]|nr:NAD(P)-dependent alcohol dehydrogenase [Steroidobacteraceae bacterium]